mmetsp:Transcript_9210/g.22500  ORF Transcript_9210/g.22500 Transcript_9210/m.22500 type:complete len:281 (-) Transcript_9210:66-908(-)
MRRRGASTTAVARGAARESISRVLVVATTMETTAVRAWRPLAEWPSISSSSSYRSCRRRRSRITSRTISRMDTFLPKRNGNRSTSAGRTTRRTIIARAPRRRAAAPHRPDPLPSPPCPTKNYGGRSWHWRRWAAWCPPILCRCRGWTPSSAAAAASAKVVMTTARRTSSPSARSPRRRAISPPSRLATGRGYCTCSWPRTPPTTRCPPPRRSKRANNPPPEVPVPAATTTTLPPRIPKTRTLPRRRRRRRRTRWWWIPWRSPRAMPARRRGSRSSAYSAW